MERVREIPSSEAKTATIEIPNLKNQGDQLPADTLIDGTTIFASQLVISIQNLV
jgi:hypothetical protein